MTRAAFLALAWILGAAGAGSAGLSRSDALAALEQNPSAAATEQVARIYRGTKDPYARLWLVDALYARVLQHKDPKALEILWEAAKDKHPDVRRKAISGLEAFRFLPEDQVRGVWLAKVEGVAQRSSKDPVPGVRSAGRDLGLAARHWRDEKAAGPPPARPSGDFSRLVVGMMPQVFVWVVCLQLIGYAWHKMGMNLLARSGPGGEAVVRSIGAFDRRPALLLFPLLTAVLLLPTLGLSLAWALVAAAMPAAEAESVYGSWRTVKFLGVVYLSAGLACYLPAALTAGRLAGGYLRSLRRVFGFMLLGLLCLVWFWPLEALRRLAGDRFEARGTSGWMARTGAPLGAVLAARLMIEENMTVWAALQAAAKRYPAAAREPGAEYWGRAPFQPPFLLWCLAAPVLFSASLIPAVLFGFKPTQLFGLWFLSNAQFAVGFGWWAGVLLSVSALGQLMILGAAKEESGS